MYLGKSVIATSSQIFLTQMNQILSNRQDVKTITKNFVVDVVFYDICFIDDD